VRVGDRLAIGSAEFEVSQPRLPCFKLGIRFGRADMVKRFLRSGRLGFYVRVLTEGVIEAGQEIRHAAAPADAPTIAELARLEASGRDDAALLERAVRTAALPDGWRERYREQLQRLTS